jgi:hypothetical protein
MKFQKYIGKINESHGTTSDIQVMMDNNGWSEVLKVMADICHTRSGNADNPETKRKWGSAGTVLDGASSKLSGLHW